MEILRDCVGADAMGVVCGMLDFGTLAALGESATLAAWRARMTNGDAAPRLLASTPTRAKPSKRPLQLRAPIRFNPLKGFVVVHRLQYVSYRDSHRLKLLVRLEDPELAALLFALSRSRTHQVSASRNAALTSEHCYDWAVWVRVGARLLDAQGEASSVEPRSPSWGDKLYPETLTIRAHTGQDSAPMFWVGQILSSARLEVSTITNRGVSLKLMHFGEEDAWTTLQASAEERLRQHQAHQQATMRQR